MALSSSSILYIHGRSNSFRVQRSSRSTKDVLPTSWRHFVEIIACWYRWSGKGFCKKHCNYLLLVLVVVKQKKAYYLSSPFAHWSLRVDQLRPLKSPRSTPRNVIFGDITLSEGYCSQIYFAKLSNIYYYRA